MLWLPYQFRLRDEGRGHFDLSCWEVHEHFTEEEHTAAIHRHATVVGTKFKPRRVLMPAEVAAKDIGIIRTREHEWTHFRQHVSTPHGVFQHRLCGFQEYMTTRYFERLKQLKLKFPRLPFHVIQFDRESKETHYFVMAWMAAELLRGALWGKTAEMSQVIGQWDMILTIAESFAPMFPGDTKGARLETRRDAEDQSCPHGHLTVRDVAEGFAKFREFWIVSQFFGVEQALEFVGPTCEGTYGYASRFISQHLEVTLFHPLVGALLEVALLCFEDPFMCEDGTVLVWEDIHPGLRLEAVVGQLAARTEAKPLDPQDCYQMALQAFGLTPALSSSALRWLRMSRGKRLATDSSHQFVKDMQTFERSTMLNGHVLRRDNPGIYFFRGLGYSRKQYKIMRDICRPAIIINPEGVFLPWGWGRKARTLPLILHSAFSSHALEEISHDAELIRTVAFGRMVGRYLAKIGAKTINSFSDDWIREQLRGYFGASVSTLIEEALV